jgi:hypothetical protein
MGPGLDVVEVTRTCTNQDLCETEEATIREMEIGEDRVRHVRHLSLAVFRHLLVNHFAILFSQNNIVWPSRHQFPKRRLFAVGHSSGGILIPAKMARIAKS